MNQRIVALSSSIIYIAFKHSQTQIADVFGSIPFFNTKFKFCKRDIFLNIRRDRVPCNASLVIEWL